MKSIRKMMTAGLLAMGMAALLSNSIADDSVAGGASFKGKVSSVDATAQTVVIDGQTYQVLRTSQIKKTDQPATINDLAVGAEVSGQYKRSAENKMEVLSMDIINQGSTVAVGGTTDATTSDSRSAFSGRVSQIDTAAKTVTIGDRTYQVLATSRLMRDSKPVAINDIKVGQHISGYYKTSTENKMEVLTADIGSAIMPAVGGTRNVPTTQAGASFNGRVTKVDPATQTITVGRQTFQLLPTSTITTGNGSPATLAEVKATQQVSGTYHKSAEGKMEVLTMQIGGKATR
jgi:ribosomal protein S1